MCCTLPVPIVGPVVLEVCENVFFNVCKPSICLTEHSTFLQYGYYMNSEYVFEQAVHTRLTIHLSKLKVVFFNVTTGLWKVTLEAGTRSLDDGCVKMAAREQNPPQRCLHLRYAGPAHISLPLLSVNISHFCLYMFIDVYICLYTDFYQGVLWL